MIGCCEADGLHSVHRPSTFNSLLPFDSHQPFTLLFRSSSTQLSLTMKFTSSTLLASLLLLTPAVIGQDTDSADAAAESAGLAAATSALSAAAGEVTVFDG